MAERFEEMRYYDVLDRFYTAHGGDMCDFEDAPDDSELLDDVDAA